MFNFSPVVLSCLRNTGHIMITVLNNTCMIVRIIIEYAALRYGVRIVPFLLRYGYFVFGARPENFCQVILIGEAVGHGGIIAIKQPQGYIVRGIVMLTRR